VSQVPRSVYPASAIVFLGLALVLFGALNLEKQKSLALTLIAGGFAAVVLGIWVSTRKL
jgi:hypothetical protein